MNAAAKMLLAMRNNPLEWQLAQTLPVPARRPIKPVYVKKFLELVEGA